RRRLRHRRNRRSRRRRRRSSRRRPSCLPSAFPWWGSRCRTCGSPNAQRERFGPDFFVVAPVAEPFFFAVVFFLVALALVAPDFSVAATVGHLQCWLIGRAHLRTSASTEAIDHQAAE